MFGAIIHFNNYKLDMVNLIELVDESHDRHTNLNIEEEC